ncbi:pyridoxamine 5'-phosphate oxidase [Virgifigura deserti]|uniref:pyridoxamine 5'-phosphate oxidase n=1 Tax=Virgifigura deserti TaxID=2268457 RepID=UPI003CCBE355
MGRRQSAEENETDTTMSEQDPKDPYLLFDVWFKEAADKEPADPNAMALATVDSQGQPSVRMVLLKGVDDQGFTFYTNRESRKGQQLLEVPRAALCFHWKSLKRQVRVEGAAEPVSDDEADAYFATRPRGSQIGAWASQQSRPLAQRFELEKRIAQYTAKFGLGAVPRPAYWSGFRVIPSRIEFWEDRPFRLHDRLVYHRRGDRWETERLYP